MATFNASGAALLHFVEGWTRVRDSSAYLRSGPDRVEAEADGVRTEFPHTFDDGTPAARVAFAKGVLTTPFGDEMTLKFARALIDAERLGADDVPDLLMISCSSADYIGHAYGPFSHEIEDYYLRLDGYLGELLGYLDEHVGKDSYVVALTADHGALPLPEEARLRGHRSAERVVTREYQAQARAAISGALTRLGLPAGTLRHLGEDGVWLDARLAESAKVDPVQLRAEVAMALRKLEFVADAFTADELAEGSDDGSRPFLGRYQRSFSLVQVSIDNLEQLKSSLKIDVVREAQRELRTFAAEGRPLVRGVEGLVHEAPEGRRGELARRPRRVTAAEEVLKTSPALLPHDEVAREVVPGLGQHPQDLLPPPVRGVRGEPHLRVRAHEAAPEVARLADPHLVPGRQPLDVRREHVLAGDRHAHPEDGLHDQAVGGRRTAPVGGGDLEGEFVDATHMTAGSRARWWPPSAAASRRRGGCAARSAACRTHASGSVRRTGRSAGTRLRPLP